MARTTQHPKDTSLNLRIDAALKAAFAGATAAGDKPAAQVLRDFMRAYVERHERRQFQAEAKRQSLSIAERSRDPQSDEAEVMRWMESVTDREVWPE